MTHGYLKCGLTLWSTRRHKTKFKERAKSMKCFGRLLLLVIALVVGGGLGYILLPDFEPVKMIIFGISCLILGSVFYQIDKRISEM